MVKVIVVVAVILVLSCELHGEGRYLKVVVAAAVVVTRYNLELWVELFEPTTCPGIMVF